jgi:hypothetical protein
MGKLEAKALFYIELNGGFVRPSLRNQFKSPKKWGFYFCIEFEKRSIILLLIKMYWLVYEGMWG